MRCRLGVHDAKVRGSGSRKIDGNARAEAGEPHTNFPQSAAEPARSLCHANGTAGGPHASVAHLTKRVSRAAEAHGAMLPRHMTAGTAPQGYGATSRFLGSTIPLGPKKK